jgi:hypothetical protein
MAALFPMPVRPHDGNSHPHLGVVSTWRKCERQYRFNGLRLLIWGAADSEFSQWRPKKAEIALHLYVMVDSGEFTCARVAMRNQRLALWAGRQLGYSEPWLAAYVQEVVTADYALPGSEDVVAKIAADFAEHGVALDAAAIRLQIRRLGG